MEGKIQNNDITQNSLSRYNAICKIIENVKMSNSLRKKVFNLIDEHAQKSEFTLYYDPYFKIIDGNEVTFFEKTGLIIKLPPKLIPNSDKFYVRRYYKWGIQTPVF